MELTKTKYKQTEVGLIPEDWDIKYIDEVVNISTGSKNTQDKVDDGEYPFYVRSQTVERINSYSYDCEAVLTVGDGVGTGKVFHYVNHKFELHQRVYIMNEFSSNLNGYYFYLFFSQNFYDRVMQMTAKSSVDSVRREMIAGMKIPLPPLPEQKAIAEVLSDIDSLIQALEQKFAKKRALKQGAMQKLLTPKEDWEVKKLGDVADINMGQSPKSAFYNKEGIGLPLVQGNADIKNRKTIIRNYTSQITKRCDKGSIIMSVRAPVGEIAITDFVACIGRGVCAINYHNKYLYHYLIYLEPSWRSLSTGSTFDSVNGETIRALEIALPQEDDQKRIATILSDMDKEIELIEKQLSKYKTIKQGLMQELLTGKIRLTV